jgi:hypothetical protein
MKFHIRGLYFISAWNIVMLFSTSVGCLKGLMVAYRLKSESIEEDAGKRSVIQGMTHDGAETSTGHEENDDVETDPMENTPLMWQC